MKPCHFVSQFFTSNRGHVKREGTFFAHLWAKNVKKVGEPRGRNAEAGRARMWAITAVHVTPLSKMHDPRSHFKYLHSYLCIPNHKTGLQFIKYGDKMGLVVIAIIRYCYWQPLNNPHNRSVHSNRILLRNELKWSRCTSTLYWYIWNWVEFAIR